jgi:hypothetical protein
MREDSGNGAFLSVGALRGEPEGRTPLLVTLKNMLRIVSVYGRQFPDGHVLRNMERRTFPWPVERRLNIFIRILLRDLSDI